MGGVEKVKRQRDQGRLTVRERIDKLVDADSFHEIGAISGIGEYDDNGELKHLTPANCVFGRGKVDGRTVVVVGDDFTVRGGSADASISAKLCPAASAARAGIATRRRIWRMCRSWRSASVRSRASAPRGSPPRITRS